MQTPNQLAESDPATPPPEADRPGDLPPAACFAPKGFAAAPPWPWACIARPAVTEISSGSHRISLDLTGVAAIDFAVSASARALAGALGVPVKVAALNPQTAAQAVTTGYGLLLAAGETEALIMLDPQAVRLLANAQLLSAGAAPSPASPGPVAEPAEVDAGIIEYLALVVFDRVLRSASLSTHAPVIREFYDGSRADAWRRKHATHGIALVLTVGGAAGGVRVNLAGVNEVIALAALSLLDAGPPPGQVNIQLALPAVTLAPQEMAAMAPGDVLLLGAPSLAQLPGACELVTDTHWSLGSARVAHDTPTYLNVSFTPGHPAPRAAAMATPEKNVIQPLIGAAAVPIDRLAGWSAGQPLALAKDATTPVTLYHGVRAIAAGELVVLGSELGVRITNLTR